MPVPRGLKHLWEDALPPEYATMTTVEGDRRGAVVRCSRCGMYAQRVRGKVIPAAAFTQSWATEWGTRQGKVRLKSCERKPE